MTTTAASTARRRTAPSAAYAATITYTYGNVGFYADTMSALMAMVEREQSRPAYRQATVGRNPNHAGWEN